MPKKKTSLIEKRKAERDAQKEKKLERSFRFLKNYFALAVFISVLFDLYLSYLVYAAGGNSGAAINFVLGLAFTVGLYFSSRLLSEKNQKAFDVYLITVGVGWAAILAVRFVNSLPLIAAKDIPGIFFASGFLYELHRLKQGRVLV